MFQRKLLLFFWTQFVFFLKYVNNNFLSFVRQLRKPFQLFRVICIQNCFHAKSIAVEVHVKEEWLSILCPILKILTHTEM
jgi:hypothetical protein